jgi:hypothetical protein
VRLAAVASVIACILAGAALAMSLLHAGPAGPQGPAGAQGPSGRPGTSAAQNRFGVCWQYFTQTSDNLTWVTSVTIDQAIYADGVYQCPQGETFVSIVPGPPAGG